MKTFTQFMPLSVDKLFKFSSSLRLIDINEGGRPSRSSLELSFSFCCIFLIGSTLFGTCKSYGDTNKPDSIFDETREELNVLLHECKTCVALRHLKDEGVFGPDVKYQVKTTKPYFSYSAILYKRWDVIFVGLNSYGCGNNNEATFIHGIAI